MDGQRNVRKNRGTGTPRTADNKHTTDYRYDANGERICKYSDLGETIYASGYYTETDGKKISKHIYIGSTRVASQVMSRSCETSTTMKRENTLYYHTDHLGSSGYVTDKKGEFYEHTEYTSSGESWVNEKVTGNANLPYKYCLKEMDNETGLYYYGARYYDAKICKWISTDPILEQYLSGKPNGGVYNGINLNLYNYCENNPINLIDPDGKRPLNSKEKELYMNIFGSAPNDIELKVIKLPFVREHSYPPEYNSTGKRTTPGEVYMRTDDPMKEDATRKTFVHELAHQWDYENDPLAWDAVKSEFFVSSINVYDYGRDDFKSGKKKIESLSNITFHEARMEFIADFYYFYDRYKYYEKQSNSSDPELASFKKQYKAISNDFLEISKKYADVLLRSGINGEFVKEVKRK